MVMLPGLVATGAVISGGSSLKYWHEGSQAFDAQAAGREIEAEWRKLRTSGEEGSGSSLNSPSVQPDQVPSSQYCLPRKQETTSLILSRVIPHSRVAPSSQGPEARLELLSSPKP